jgi:hypothetical protein
MDCIAPAGFTHTLIIYEGVGDANGKQSKRQGLAATIGLVSYTQTPRET